MAKPGLGARLRYAFDKSMAAGTIALIGWLGLVSLVIIAIAGAFLAITHISPEGEEPMSFIEGTWASLMRTLDSGTMGGDTGWGFRLVMLLVTLAGIFVVSALIGVLSTGLEGKLDELRKGRSLVLEQDHTIIFNWSPSIFDVISELVIANESRRRPRIVIMSEKDKVEMEDEIAAKVPDTKNTRIICRSGDPTDLYDIAIVNPQTARSIIILSPETDDPDSLRDQDDPRPDQRSRPARGALSDRRRDSRSAQCRGRARRRRRRRSSWCSPTTCCRGSSPSRCASPGSARSIPNCSISTAAKSTPTEQPELVGKTFGEAIFSYETSSLIGLCDPDGAVSLNPPMDTMIVEGMKAIIIAEDDDEIEIKERGAPPARRPAAAAAAGAGARAHPDARLEPPRADDRARTVALRRARLAADDRRRHARARGGL